MSVKGRAARCGVVGVVIGLVLGSGWIGLAAVVLLVAAGAQWADIWGLVKVDIERAENAQAGFTRVCHSPAAPEPWRRQVKT